MYTKYGPIAKHGDYVLVLDIDYVHRTASVLPAKVHGNKAFTGKKIAGNGKYIHKLEAIIKLPAEEVNERIKANIEQDITLYDAGRAKK